jgi:hypothetical protein
MFESARWVRARNFYKRNSMAFWSAGLVVFLHVFWWQIQQNPNLVPVHQRKRSVGPFKVYYLDELDFFKKNTTTSDDKK